MSKRPKKDARALQIDKLEAALRVRDGQLRDAREEIRMNNEDYANWKARSEETLQERDREIERLNKRLAEIARESRAALYIAKGYLCRISNAYQANANIDRALAVIDGTGAYETLKLSVQDGKRVAEPMCVLYRNGKWATGGPDDKAWVEVESPEAWPEP